MDYHAIMDPLNISVCPNEIPSLDFCIPMFNDVLIIDVGAFNGLWSVAALINNAKFVIALDPCPIEHLARSLHDFPGQYRIINGFVTDEQHLNDLGWRTTIDRIIQTEEYNQVGFIKIDVEGAEIEVLKGAQNTIMKFRPNMLIESHDYMYDGRKEEIINLLKGWGLGIPINILFHGDKSQKTYHIIYKLQKTKSEILSTPSGVAEYYKNSWFKSKIRGMSYCHPA